MEECAPSFEKWQDDVSHWETGTEVVSMATPNMGYIERKMPTNTKKAEKIGKSDRRE